ncbi:MAG: tetratricopeptide repeat protein [Bacteroidales bacterium]|nr:tetratricopeptide repeat protein [Bacteroidales bacterium]
MKTRHLIYTIFAVALAAACNHSGDKKEDSTPDKAKLSQEVSDIDKSLRQDIMAESADPVKGNNAVEKFVQYADAFPDDSISAYYLHRAAAISNNMGEFDKMVEYYDRVINNYPNYASLIDCYYEKAIDLDNAGRKEEARKAYQNFLDEYPDHYLASDIQKSMKLLDYSNEELIKSFEKKNNIK